MPSASPALLAAGSLLAALLWVGGGPYPAAVPADHHCHCHCESGVAVAEPPAPGQHGPGLGAVCWLLAGLAAAAVACAAGSRAGAALDLAGQEARRRLAVLRGPEEEEGRWNGGPIPGTRRNRPAVPIAAWR